MQTFRLKPLKAISLVLFPFILAHVGVSAMLPIQSSILRKFQQAVENPDIPAPVRHRIRDLPQVLLNWCRMINQLNVHAKVAEKAAMISAKRLILEDNVKQKEKELERALIASLRSIEDGNAGRNCIDIAYFSGKLGDEIMGIGGFTV